MITKYYTSKELEVFSYETLRDLYSILIDEDPNVTLNQVVLCNVLHLKVPRYILGNVLDADLVMDFRGEIYRVLEARHRRREVDAPLILPLQGSKTPKVFLAPLFKIDPFVFSSAISEEQEDLIQQSASYLDSIKLDDTSITPGCLYISSGDFADYLIKKLEQQ
jgi:hypothetical protein